MEHVLIGAKSNKIIKFVRPGWGEEARSLKQIVEHHANEEKEKVVAYIRVGSATPQGAKWEES